MTQDERSAPGADLTRPQSAQRYHATTVAGRSTVAGGREDLIAAALQAQHRLARALHTPSDGAWLQLDLTITQLKALFVLAEAALPVSKLAEALGIGRPAATNLVERLVRLALAMRTEDAADRRRTVVLLTQAGDELVTRLRQGGQARMCAWLGQLDDDDLAALARGLQALARVAPCAAPTCTDGPAASAPRDGRDDG